LLIGCGTLFLGFILLIGTSAIFLTPMAAKKMSEWGDGLCVSTRYQEAITMYSRAAFLGNAHAQAMLANGYGFESRNWGIKNDLNEAIKWARKAAAQNDAEGEFLLGAMYYQGRPIPKDLGQARYWFKKAVEEGVSGGHRTGFRDDYVIFGKADARDFLRFLDKEEKSQNRSSSPAPSVRSTPSSSAMTVDELEGAFKTDPKAAETRYTGKTIVVSGTVDWIGNDLLYKKPAINLIGSGATAHTNCVFPESARSAVNALKVGQKVTLRADFGGYLAGYVSLKNCEIVR
jgi:TPR repeat protein